MHSLYNDILIQELKKYRDKKILVAFSGGKDSLMLLDFINKQKESLNIYAGACHINHGLRHTAKRDEDFCRLYCIKNNIDFYTYNISEELKKDNSGGIEASARKYRYKFLLHTVKENNYDFLFTGHTYSDDIESFFVDLYTGASLFTLGGIMYENDKIIRPMLNITTEMVNEYIIKNNLEPVFDETKKWLDIYFSGKDPKFTPPLKMETTSFRKTVWEILLTIPYGRTITYGAIAERIAGQKGVGRMSAQAVGGAVGHNAISLIIPCHRVVGTNGSLTGYAGGMEKKVKLLALEKTDMTGLFVPKKGMV